MTIEEYVMSEYGAQTGPLIMERQKKQFARIVSELQDKTDNQMKTLTQTILPRIALYKALIDLQYSKDEAFSKVKKYLDEYVGPAMNKKLKLMEITPGFFSLFRKKMYQEVSESDNWNVQVGENTDDSICYSITRCLWYDACRENGCVELCQIFCDVDHIIYGNMRKVVFTRSGTIGRGADHCDFCFRKK